LTKEMRWDKGKKKNTDETRQDAEGVAHLG
jgi:hypothetical protein